MKRIKHRIIALGAFAAAMAAPASFAAYYDFTATIHTVAATDPSLWPGFNYYILLNGATSAGSCYVDPNSGKVLMALMSPAAYASALAAQAAERQVYVSLDDTHKDAHGNCKVRLIKVLG